jgi:hypothetical protein
MHGFLIVIMLHIIPRKFLLVNPLMSPFRTQVFAGDGIVSSPGHAIAARNDLDGTNHLPNGAIDAKVSKIMIERHTYITKHTIKYSRGAVDATLR